jgi:hypothetical protein
MRGRGRGFCLLLVVSLALSSALCGGGERAKVMIMGKPGIINMALAFLIPDPLTDPTPVLLREVPGVVVADLRRSLRQYFPRSYERLVEFEYIMFSEIEVLYLEPKQTMWLYDSIYKEGLGAMNDRSVMSMASSIGGAWADSILSDAFPNDADAVVGLQGWCYNRPVRYVINTNPGVPPIYSPYRGLEGTEFAFMPSGAQICVTIPREGAVVTTYQIGDFKLGDPGSLPDPRFTTPGWVPHSMYWRYGNSTTWTHSDRLTEYWNSVYNPYGPDMILAEILFSTGRRLPEDVVLVHNLRSRFWEYASSRSITMSFLEFIDLFGADTAPISSKMGEAYDKTREAEGLYLEQEYGQALSRIEEALREMEGLREEALRLRDRALVWIYLIEWFAVSGVFLVGGLALWALMIRRRLYREVSVTRALV